MRHNRPLLYLAAAAGMALVLGLSIQAAVLRSQENLENAAETQPPLASQADGEEAAGQQGDGSAIAQTPGIDDGIREDKNVYNQDDPDSIVCFYVTVRYGSEGRGTNHTLDQVNNAVRFENETHVDTEVYADALVQVGDETGPQPGMLGYGENDSNATIRIRGNTSSLAPQKSYQLSLNDEAGLWRGQSNIALNKHSGDATRFRNKLYFDLAKNLTDVPSLRTQFVRLFVKDETSGATQFVDYGLYTQVEVPTKKYLANHGLDRAGYLYKAIDFNFETNDLIQNYNDPGFDEKAMDTVISCRGRQDNSRLMEMIAALNDTSNDIDDVIDTYFDRDNYMQWLAFNLLMGNLDTTMQNYFLYSPLNGTKFYFIPWDSDGSLMRTEYRLEGNGSAADWEYGIGNYWGVLLHQRFLRKAGNRADLAQVVEEMHAWLNKETVDQMAAGYYETVAPYLYAMPDYLYLGHTRSEVEQIVASLGDEVEENYRNFQDSLTDPMPFWMYAAQEDGGTVTLSWEAAYDFEGVPFTYRVQVSRYPDMRSPLVDQSGLLATSLTVPKSTLGSGEFYWKVTATRADGATVPAMNEVIVNDVYYLGVYRLDLS